MKTFAAILKVYWAFLYYPLLLTLFIWLWVKGAHWIWGAAVVLIMVVFDPIWVRLFFRRK